MWDGICQDLWFAVCSKLNPYVSRITYRYSTVKHLLARYLYKLFPSVNLTGRVTFRKWHITVDVPLHYLWMSHTLHRRKVLRALTEDFPSVRWLQSFITRSIFQILQIGWGSSLFTGRRYCGSVKNTDESSSRTVADYIVYAYFYDMPIWQIHGRRFLCFF